MLSKDRNKTKLIKIFLIISFVICWFSVSTSYDDLLVFDKKKIPFRSFEVKKRNEETMGQLFCFFVLETILLGKALNIDPYNQPSVELIKKETKKILI